MTTTIDSAGRLVIPKEVRRQSGIVPGTPLEVRWHDGQIEIEPVYVPMKLIRRGMFLVATKRENSDPLMPETVEMTLDAIRNERAESNLHGA